MSKIFDLAKTFEQTSKQEAESIEQSVRNVLAQHERNIVAELAQNEKNIKSAIHAANKRVSMAILKPYWWILGALAVVGAIMLILLLVMGMKISDRYTEIQAQKQTLAMMQNTTNGLQLSKCKTQDGQDLVCVAIDSTVQQSWGKKGEYRAILPK